MEVRLFATFREGRQNKYFLELDDGTTVLDVLNLLNINPEEASIILINGKNVDVTKVLSNEDVLSLFPPVGGG